MSILSNFAFYDILSKYQVFPMYHPHDQVSLYTVGISENITVKEFVKLWEQI